MPLALKGFLITALMAVSNFALAESGGPGDDPNKIIFDRLPAGVEEGICTKDNPTSHCTFTEIRRGEGVECKRVRDVRYRHPPAETTAYSCVFEN